MKVIPAIESRARELRWVTVLILVAVMAAAGCSKQSNEPPAAGQAPSVQQAPSGQPTGEAAKPESQPAAGASGTPSPATSGEHSETAEGGSAPVVPGATPAEIWVQIQHEQGEFAEVIQKADLSAVHHHAFAIRDLVAAAAAKSKGHDASETAKLEKIVKSVGTLAEKLDKSGDSGDLSGTKKHYASLQQQLQLLSPLLGVH